jgi:AmmeMemoRadiSam system protein B
MKNTVFFFLIFCEALIMPTKSHSDDFLKEPNVSGQFYPKDPKELSTEIDGYISAAQVPPYKNHIPIIISPHAGYHYSGPVAAYSYKSVSQLSYKTIIILAPSHFYGFDGVSIWPQGAFKTPLGEVPVDTEMTSKLIGANQKFSYDPKAFAREHALEVEIPFLQRTFKDFKIVPIIIGQAALETLDQLAVKLNELIGDRKDVLIVVSTDLSHYHPYQEAEKMDALTLQTVKDFKVDQLWQGNFSGTLEMCGFMPVTAALLYAKHKGLHHADLIHYANSGDVTGEKNSVVGYGAMAIYE